MRPLLFSMLVAFSAGIATFQPAPLTDTQGDPLPLGAAARIGTTQLRHGNQVASVAFSPDGKKIVSTDWYSVGTWDVQSGRTLTFRMLDPQNSCWPVLSADGSLIACRLKNQALGVQETDTGKVRSSFASVKGRVNNLVFSKDNRWLAFTGDEGTVSLWDVATEKLSRTWHLPQKDDESRQAFSPDGKLLMNATHEGHIILWNVQTGKEMWHIEPRKDKHRDYYINGLDISPDGEVAAIMHHWARIELWHVKTGKFLREFEVHGSWSGPRFSPDGKRLLCGTYNSPEEILQWDVALGTLACTLNGDPKGYAASFACSGDGKFLAVGGLDYAVHVWNLATGKLVSPPVNLGGDVSVSILADGKTLLSTGGYWAHRLSGAVDPRFDTWDLTAKLLKQATFDAKGAHHFAISHDAGTVAFAIGPHFFSGHRPVPNGFLRSVIRLCDLENGQELAKVEGVPSQITDMKFSPDNRFLFANAFNAGPNDDDYHRVDVVQVWKRTSPTALAKIADLPSRYFTLSFSCAPTAGGSVCPRMPVGNSTNVKPESCCATAPVLVGLSAPHRRAVESSHVPTMIRPPQASSNWRPVRRFASSIAIPATSISLSLPSHQTGESSPAI